MAHTMLITLATSNFAQQKIALAILETFAHTHDLINN